MLDHYMEMRQHTHLFYKVIREPSWVDLVCCWLVGFLRAVSDCVIDYTCEASLRAGH